MTDFTCRYASGYGWMFSDTHSKIPEFVSRHSDHLEQLRVVDEHDDRYGYRYFGTKP
jgi:hypothetical protein